MVDRSERTLWESWYQSIPPALTVAFDRAIQGHLQDPTDPHFWWVRGAVRTPSHPPWPVDAVGLPWWSHSLKPDGRFPDVSWIPKLVYVGGMLRLSSTMSVWDSLWNAHGLLNQLSMAFGLSPFYLHEMKVDRAASGFRLPPLSALTYFASQQDLGLTADPAYVDVVYAPSETESERIHSRPCWIPKQILTPTGQPPYLLFLQCPHPHELIVP